MRFPLFIFANLIYTLEGRTTIFVSYYSFFIVIMARSNEGKVNLKAHIDLLASKDMFTSQSNYAKTLFIT